MSIQHTPNAIPEFTMADRLRKAREYACLDQEELATRMGVVRQTISRHELGQVTHPRRITVTAWALACGVDVNWLWTGQANDPSDPGGLPVTQSGCIEDAQVIALARPVPAELADAPRAA